MRALRSLAVGRGSIVRIEPLDQTGEVLASPVLYVIRHDSAQHEAFTQLEAEHQVAQLAARDPRSVLFGRRITAGGAIVPQATAGQDAALVQALAKLTPPLVERGADALTASVGVHVDVRSVQRVGVRVVVGEVTAVGDAGPRVRAQWIRAQVDDQRRGRAHDLSVKLRYQLALWENSLMAD